MKGTRLVLPLVFAGVLLGSSAPSAPGQVPTGVMLESVITTVPKDTYLPATIVATRDGHITYVNLDAADHDVVARVYDDTFQARPDYIRPDDSAPWCVDFFLDCPLFWTPLIPGPGTTTEVLGLADAEVGKSYEFYCSIHPDMRGILMVVA